jgi:predicted cupin superfamily sugar epimerase
MDAQEIIRSLDLRPHPEGGWYRELHRSALRVTTSHASRCALTSIYYLLQHHERSRWHTVEADEIWHFYAGAPLELFAYEPIAGRFVRRVLAPPATRTEPAGAQSEPAAVIPAGTWQAARTLGRLSIRVRAAGSRRPFHRGHATPARTALVSIRDIYCFDAGRVQISSTPEEAC